MNYNDRKAEFLIFPTVNKMGGVRMLESSVNLIWILLGTALMFVMQAGFAMLEAGFTRVKNSGNIIMKNVINLAIGSVVFFAVGFGFMYNGDRGGLSGLPDIFARGDYTFSGTSSYAFIIFQTMFCATAATIVSGALAERTKFIAYIIYAVVISAVIYPISGHWIWNPEGWLAKMGFVDFAGSTAVHLVGGLCALVGAAFVGPRIGKYAKGKPRAIPGHSLVFSALGVFLLWLGWFGFNGGSTLSVTGSAYESVGKIFLNTNLAAAIGGIVAMTVTWLRYGKPDISMTFNGILAGLVAITAGCHTVEPASALIIGGLASAVMVASIEFIERKLKIDDPVGAISVHGVCGLFGTLMVGIFSVDGGTLYSGRFDLLGVQALGVLAVGAWVLVCAAVLFVLIKATVGLRVSEDAELSGLDLREHGYAGSYSLAMPGMEPGRVFDMESDSADELNANDYKPDGKMRNVVVIINPNKFESLKNALEKIDINGMTVSNVSGCGIQRGRTEYYRGVEHDIQLLPKVKVEIVISTVPLALLIDTVKKTCRTGNIGDGKIFVYEVANVIKIRTGETDKLALV
jgi:Amt family ammonium transporter